MDKTIESDRGSVPTEGGEHLAGFIDSALKDIDPCLEIMDERRPAYAEIRAAQTLLRTASQRLKETEATGKFTTSLVKTLVEGDKVDSAGDMFPMEVLQKMVDDFHGPLPIHPNFDWKAKPVGVVKRLYLDQKRVMAEISVDPNIDYNQELALGGKGNFTGVNPRIIESFSMELAALTHDKVQ